MDPHESPLEMAQRHVAEGEARVARQTALLVELANKGFDTAQAEALLAALRHALRLMREHLTDFSH